MILSRFLRTHLMTKDVSNSAAPESVGQSVDSDFCHCIDLLGGKTFNHGLYRVYRWDEIVRYTDRVTELFTPTRGRIVVFASDWHGRQFAIDSKESTASGPAVTFFDLGAPNSFCTDMAIVDFHNVALTEKADAALAISFYNQWHQRDGVSIEHNQCIEYKIPLFLGGEDDLNNLELIDMDVYLSLCSQLYHQIRKLPEGASVGKVSTREQQ
jgi:hypothetical protein